MATTEVVAPPTHDQSAQNATPAGLAPGAAPNGGQVTTLVTGIIDDAQQLIRQQAEMFKAEMREDFQRSKRAAEFGAIGVVCATVGVLALITALAYLLNEQWHFSLWASWGIIGCVFMIAGVALGGFSYVLLERFNPLPDKTFNALKENLSWQTK